MDYISHSYFNQYCDMPIVGPETSVPKEWNEKVERFSLYSFSSISFAFVGIIGYEYNRIPFIEAVVLMLVGISSYQSDVTFLGIKHSWRTMDSFLAVWLIVFHTFIIIYDTTVVAIIATIMIAYGCYTFTKSINSTTFAEREYWHTQWHLIIQAALLLLYFDKLQ